MVPSGDKARGESDRSVGLLPSDRPLEGLSHRCPKGQHSRQLTLSGRDSR